MTTRMNRQRTALLVAGFLIAATSTLIASCQKRPGAEGVGATPMQGVGDLQIGVANAPDLPHIGDNALAKLAPLIEAMTTRRPALELSPEPEAFLRVLGIDGGDDLDAALAEVESRDPRIAMLLEPTLGVTLAPTMGPGVRVDIPSALAAASA